MVNAYICPQCKMATVTRNIEPGVTPLMIGCRATPVCDGMAISQFYRGFFGMAPVRWGWRHPTKAEFERADSSMQEYYAKGAMMLVPLKNGKEHAPE